ncbi:MAG: glycosyltransferase family 2 protein [Dehalococcoidia bacterium]
MGISLVIRCYNEERYIGRLLKGVQQQTVQDVEIIVVDSGSTDSTLSIVSQFPVKLLSIKPEDFSFGRSLNIGCQAATKEFIAIASAHVYPKYQDWLERLVAPFSDPQVALVYGKQRGDATTKYSEHRILTKWFPEQSNPNQDHPFCNNANAAIRQSIWEQLKYDEDLTGVEDTDWAKRAMALGYKIAYAADTEVAHVHNESLGKIYNRYRREAIALKRIFPEERFSLWDFTRLFTANLFSDYGHAGPGTTLWRNLFSICGFRLMQFWGTYRGFARQGPVTSQLKQTFYYPGRPESPKPVSRESIAQPPVEYADTPATPHSERPQ